MTEDARVAPPEAGAAGAAPLVSVVIPAYNAGATLEQTLQSLYAQTHPAVEIVVVDDGSTDDTPQVLARHQPRVRVIRQANAGLAGARNAGLAAARGRYIALMDADDLCAPDRLEVQVAYLEASPDVGLCASDFSAFGDDGRIAGSFLRQYYKAVSRAPRGLESIFDSRRERELGPRGAVATYDGTVFESLAFGNFLHPPTVMVRREVLERVGPLSTAYRNLCDYEWLLRVSRETRVGLIDAPLLDYRLSPAQMSGDHNTLQVKLDSVEVMAWLERIDPEFCRKQAAALRERLADMHAGAADAYAGVDRAAGLRHLRLAWRHGAPRPRLAKIAVKLAVPLGLVRSVRARALGFEWAPLAKGLLTCLPFLRHAVSVRRRATDRSGFWTQRRDSSRGYGMWVKHLAMLQHCGMELPTAIAEVGPGDSLGLGIAALISGVRTYHAYDVRPFADPAADRGRVAEIARCYDAREALRTSGWPDVEGIVATRGTTAGDAAWRAADTSPARLAEIEDSLAAAAAGGPVQAVRYVAPWDAADTPQAAYDLVLSHTVLEYVEDLDAMFARFARMLKPNGWMSHQVDLSSLGITRAWNGHLAYGPLAWRMVAGRRGYLPNRRLAPEYLAVLERHGFEPQYVLRYDDPGGLRHEQLAAPFRRFAARDTRCHSLFLVARLASASPADPGAR